MKINEDDLGKSLIGMVVMLAEIIKETLEKEALKRVESGILTNEEIEKLGNALADLEERIERIKKEEGCEDKVDTLRNQLDANLSKTIKNAINLEK